jgi:SPP1 gp7 family putative phage head morphogenesis protein
VSTANTVIFTREVRHQIGLTRLASGTVRELTSILNGYDDELRGITQRIDEDTTATGVNWALGQIKNINAAAYDDVGVAMEKSMQELAQYEVDFQLRLLGESIPSEAFAQMDFDLPAAEALEKVVIGAPIDGALMSEYVAGMENGRWERMRDAVRRQYVTHDEVTKGIQRAIFGTPGLNYRDGILERSRKSLDQTTRTIQNGVISNARELFYGENDDLIEGVQWVAVLDMKTSETCRALDGTVFPLNSGPRPPAHMNCRSTVTPIVRDWEAMGLEDLTEETRASLTGEVPAAMTYDDWLREQPANVQDEVLGPSRGKMFRDGMTLERFVDDTGRQYTLAELAELEA